MSDTPYLAVTQKELNNLPDIELRKGDEVVCPKCKQKHVLKHGTDEDGKEYTLLLFYKCDITNESYLAAINGISIMNRKI